jgi:pimeloyl-ACP methyl ester carboxylesterase
MLQLLLLSTLLPCTVPDVAPPVRCGTVQVAENRAVAGGRTLDLHVVVLGATGPAAPDPVLILAGGPGQAATTLASAIAVEQAALRRERDIVLVDQRGTGRSNGLPCKPWDEMDLRSYLEEPAAADVARCREELSGRADLTQYTTSAWVDDLEDVRKALGYPRWNLDAGSYGTRVALLYMSRHPAAVRVAVLRAVNGPEYRIPLPFSRAGQEALEALFTDCAKDQQCVADYPALRRDFERAMSGLEKPVRVTIQHPVTRKPVAAQLTREVFVARVHLLLFSSGSVAQLPRLLHLAANGIYGPFAQLAVDFGKAIADQIDWGQQLSVLCTEDLPRITEMDIEKETAGTFLGGEMVRDAMAQCQGWPRGQMPADWGAPVTASIPTLLVSGALDPATPPSMAEAVARGLKTSLHVVVPRGSHMDGSACIEGIVGEAIRRGRLEGLDTSCVEGTTRPPFARP